MGRIDIDLGDFEKAITESSFQSLSINTRHALTVGLLPAVHRDPFDRILIAQATVEELRVVSHDRVFERYGLAAEGLPPIII